MATKFRLKTINTSKDMVEKVSEIKNIGHRAFLLGKKRGFQVITLLYFLCLPLQNHTGSTEQETTSLHEVTGEGVGCANTAPRLAVLQKHTSSSRPKLTQGSGHSSTNSLCTEH